MITLEELLQSGVDHAHKILIEERRKTLTHFYNLVSRNGEMAMVMVHWQSEIEKEVMLAGVRKLAIERDAVMAMGLSEAWALSPPKGVIQTLEEGRRWMRNVGPPAEHPQRQEVVMIFATDGERTIGKMLHMKRIRPGGRITALVPEETDAGHFEGRIIDVLPKRQDA